MTSEALADRLARVREAITAACRKVGRDPGAVRIVAITKGHSAQVLIGAVEAGLKDIGESRVQEAIAKFDRAGATLSASGVRLHMVGHLQRNKVRDAVVTFDWIQSVDSIRLARALAERADRCEPIPVLIEINAAGEEQKFGFPPEEAVQRGLEIAGLEGLAVRGAMAMAPWTNDEATLRQVFRAARRVFEDLKAARPGDERIDTLSMGMSNDYPLAIEEGSTMVRLGTVLFGSTGN
ncbi:MAG TPA: YggS family pyridoxal phosphate-dependent enzyme [Gemmatimonadota bacterium]|nr:YggS family pyridoxal phosphate-dependent enzyme [Gemmatimonadota bacterium]